MNSLGYASLEEAWGMSPRKPGNKPEDNDRRRRRRNADKEADKDEIQVPPLLDKPRRRVVRETRRESDIESEPDPVVLNKRSDPVVTNKRRELEPRAEPIPNNDGAITEAFSVEYDGSENHDVFLYVFSGVLLLFIFEQFIQVGLHLGIRQNSC